MLPVQGESRAREQPAWALAGSPWSGLHCHSRATMPGLSPTLTAWPESRRAPGLSEWGDGTAFSLSPHAQPFVSPLGRI